MGTLVVDTDSSVPADNLAVGSQIGEDNLGVAHNSVLDNLDLVDNLVAPNSLERGSLGERNILGGNLAEAVDNDSDTDSIRKVLGVGLGHDSQVVEDIV